MEDFVLKIVFCSVVFLLPLLITFIQYKIGKIDKNKWFRSSKHVVGTSAESDLKRGRIGEQYMGCEEE